jgi:hypothetical protein
MLREFRLLFLSKYGPWRAVALSAATAMVLSMPLHAAVIVNDTWLDGTDSDPASPTYSENGVDSDTDGNLESVWFQGGVGTLDPTGVGGPLRGNLTAGGTSSGSWTTYFTPEGGEVNLANAGDSMKLTWVFALTNVNASNTSQNFRIALLDSPAAVTRLSANGSPASGAYTGYGIFANMGQTLGNSNPFQLRERVVASGDVLSTAGNWGANGVANSGLANGATSGATGYAAATPYTFIATLTRTALGELQVDMSLSGGSLDNDGTASVSVIDSSPNGGSFKFDTFALRPSGATTTAELVDTSLFRVEFNAVPEPASVLLFSISGLGLMLLRRRSG